MCFPICRQSPHPRCLHKVEEHSCHFPHFSFANKPPDFCFLNNNNKKSCLHECRQICLKFIYPPLIKDHSQQEPLTVLCTLLPAHWFAVQGVLHPSQSVCWSLPALELLSQHELYCGIPAGCIRTSQVPQPKDPHHAMLGGL